MSAIGTLLILFVTIGWIIYATFRLAPMLEERWNAFGQVIAYAIFALMVVVIEVIFSKF
jgi:hypothetical protein